jgi:hypothetical protein
VQPGLAVEVGVGQFGSHRTRREAGEGETTAGGEDPVEELEVTDAPVGRQMVEAARVVDQVVRAAEFDRVESEGVTAVEPDRAPGPGLAGAFLGPGDRDR